MAKVGHRADSLGQQAKVNKGLFSSRARKERIADTDLLLKALGTIDIDIAKPEELVVAKSVRNNFLALKVSFFNQIFDYCETHNLDYESVAHLVGADDRIGHSHTQITEERGFGGHCFPKDVKALITSAKAYGCSLSLLEEASNYNNKVRKDQV